MGAMLGYVVAVWLVAVVGGYLPLVGMTVIVCAKRVGLPCLISLVQ